MDYLNVLLHIPLYCYHFGVTASGFVIHLPYPPGREIFGSMVVFIILWPVRSLMQVLFPPERMIPKRVYRRKTAPTSHDHQTASSAVSSLFNHH